MEQRRRYPRFEIEPGLPGTLRDGTRITLIELSAEGCRVHAQQAGIPVDAEQLQFRIGREEPLLSVPATAVHASTTPWIFHPSSLIGFQLEPESTRRLAQAIAPLIHR